MAKSGRQLSASAASTGAIGPLREMRADGGDEVSAGGKTDHADLVRIDMPLRGMLANKPQRALRVLQRCLHFRVVAMTVDQGGTGVGHAVLQQHAGDAARGQPVADLRAFEVHGQDLVAAAGEHHHGHAGVVALGRVHGHRRPADVRGRSRTPASDRGPGPAAFRARSPPGHARARVARRRRGRPVQSRRRRWRTRSDKRRAARGDPAGENGVVPQIHSCANLPRMSWSDGRLFQPRAAKDKNAAGA